MPEQENHAQNGANIGFYGIKQQTMVGQENVVIGNYLLFSSHLWEK